MSTNKDKFSDYERAEEIKLFCIVRTGLETMTPGRIAAQVAHAASAAAKTSPKTADSLARYTLWVKQAGTFGTTIVLNGGSSDNFNRIFVALCEEAPLNFWGEIVDPTYPILDGDTVHLVEVSTVIWYLGFSGDIPAIDELKLL